MTNDSWRRRLVEGAVIVASILLAFAIDAAWDSRREQERRDALLSALAREMALATTERDRVAQYHANGRDASAALLGLDAGERDVTRVDSLLREAYNSTATFDASSGALSGLLYSSDLDLIDDEELLLELTSYPGLVANLNREQGYLVEVGFRMLDYLSAEGVDVSLLNEPSGEQLPSVPWPLGPTRAHAIVGDPGFRSLLSEIWWRYRNCLSALDELRMSIDRIRMLIEPVPAP